MTVEELKTLKAKLKAEMLRRDGVGSLVAYGGSAYDFSTQPAVGMKTKPDFGEKTVDIFLKIEDFKDLKLTQEGNPIPRALGSLMLDEIDRLSKEVKTGESVDTVRDLFPTRQVEKTSCRGSCSGLCVGSCISQCNGCTGCTETCGTGCANGCSGCSGSCQETCTGLSVIVGR